MNPRSFARSSEVEAAVASDLPRITYLVKRLESAVRRDLDAVLHEQGLTTPQYAALSILGRSPGLSSAQLARRAFVSAQSMHVMVAAFVRSGFVRRQPDSENQRILRNYLTSQGEEKLARGQEVADRLEQRMVEGLTEEQVRCLRDAMDVCVRNLLTPSDIAAE